ncbi:B3 domain-containing protein_Os12g40080 [Spinacia oleracea]|uniref:B3 domain-containing protein_Os12g40080 n=1 Tax=Spinacia oleracea TaxID=3562 RepID=A0A9R0JLR2_SPIOL|nr:B3 domain-containing protein LOC_Os12g40080-like [Spinacia oleracea]
MEPTFLNHEFTAGVIIPSEFAKTYLDKSPCTLKLLTDNIEKTWEVSFTGGGSRHAKLSTGWEVFASDNKLKVGDICMFELIACQELKVCIIRASSSDPRKIIKPSKVPAKACASTQPEDIDSWPKQPRPPTRDPRDAAVMAAEAYTSAFAGNPSFSIAITSGYMKYNILNIPLRWVETYMRGSDKRNITLKGGKKSLNTKLIIYRHITGSHCKLTGGISKFFHDNAIIQGDVCVFELVNNVPNTLKVLVFR